MCVFTIFYMIILKQTRYFSVNLYRFWRKNVSEIRIYLSFMPSVEIALIGTKSKYALDIEPNGIISLLGMVILRYELFFSFTQYSLPARTNSLFRRHEKWVSFLKFAPMTIRIKHVLSTSRNLRTLDVHCYTTSTEADILGFTAFFVWNSEGKKLRKSFLFLRYFIWKSLMQRTVSFLWCFFPSFFSRAWLAQILLKNMD